MSEEANAQGTVLPPPAETLPARPEIAEPEVKATAGANGNVEIHEPAKEVAREPEPEPVKESAPIESMIAFPHLKFICYSLADSILLAFSSRARDYKRQTNCLR